MQVTLTALPTSVQTQFPVTVVPIGMHPWVAFDVGEQTQAQVEVPAQTAGTVWQLSCVAPPVPGVVL